MHRALQLIAGVIACVLLVACAPEPQQLANSDTDTVKASADVAAPPATTARSYIISPVDGATVPSIFKVVFGLDGMGVAPAGTVKDGTGHHHLLINVDTLPDLSRPLPSSDQIIHFGGGQTEAPITLPPGEHTLQLLLGDYAHIPLGEDLLSDKITITVVE